MDSKEIEEGNRIIFDFMGCKHSLHEDFDKWEMSKLTFHSSWDALMRVVEKIETLHSIRQHSYLNVRISQGYVEIEGVPSGRIFRNTSVEDSKITALWLAVTDFIKIYNELQLNHE